MTQEADFTCFCIVKTGVCHACGDASYLSVDVLCECGTLRPSLCQACKEPFMQGRTFPRQGLFTDEYLKNGKGAIPWRHGRPAWAGEA